jgi:nucleotide-binding universal stress UspA family protein
MIHASRILVPIKGNPSDAEVLELACEIARKSKAQVYAIHVIEVKRTLPLDAELQEEAERGEDLLNQAEQVGERLGVTIHTDLLQARDVGSAIVDEVLERDVDLVILGFILKKRYGEFGLGATLPFVLKHAPCRVWVCRQALTSAASDR